MAHTLHGKIITRSNKLLTKGNKIITARQCGDEGVLYYQAHTCGTTALADVWFSNGDGIPGDHDAFTIVLDGDGHVVDDPACYYMDYDDPSYDAPGGTLYNVGGFFIVGACEDCMDCGDECLTIREGEEDEFVISKCDRLRMIWNTLDTCSSITGVPREGGTIDLDFDSFGGSYALFVTIVGDIRYEATVIALDGAVKFEIQNTATTEHYDFSQTTALVAGNNGSSIPAACTVCGDVYVPYDPSREFPPLIMSGPTATASGFMEGAGGSMFSTTACDLAGIGHYPMGDISATLLSAGVC